VLEEPSSFQDLDQTSSNDFIREQAIDALAIVLDRAARDLAILANQQTRDRS